MYDNMITDVIPIPQTKPGPPVFPIGMRPIDFNGRHVDDDGFSADTQEPLFPVREGLHQSLFSGSLFVWTSP